MRGTQVTDTFSRTSASGWGSADTGQAWSGVGTGGTVLATDFTVGSGLGQHSVPATSGYRLSYLAGFSQAFVDLTVIGSVNAIALGAPIEVANFAVRGTSTSSYYLFRVQVEPSQAVTAKIFAPGNPGAQIGSITVPGITYIANLQLRVRVQSVGKVHRMKVWKASDPEPVAWILSVIDSTYTGAGFIGLRSGIATGNTNTLPLTFLYDNFSSTLLPDFPNDPLPLTVLAAFGADLSADPSTWPWTNITGDVRAGTVTIAPGRGDETGQASSAACSFQLLNNNKDFSAHNPAGPNYPNVRRNTPIHVIVDPATRFFGYANGFTPSWDTSGKQAIVSVSASGSLRRLTQGKSPLRSVLYRSISAAKPVAYWSLEDGSTASQGASALTGGSPLAWSGTPPTRSSKTLRGSAPLITLATDTGLAGSVQPYTSSANWWGIQFVINIPTRPTSDLPIITLFTNGSRTRWDLGYGPGGGGVMFWNVFDANGNMQTVSTTGFDGSFPDGNPWGKDIIIGWNIHQSGSNIAVDGAWAWQDSGGLDLIASFFNGTITGATNGTVNRVEVLPGWSRSGWSYGHISVWGQPFSLYSRQMAGYNNELVTDRLARLCAEQGVPLTITGTSTTRMGPQGIDSFVNLLRDCESTDLGLLYDGFGPGLGYITRAARYNQTAALTLDMAAGQVAAPFAPVDDDQKNRNLYKVDRKNGSSATYEDTDGPLGTTAIGTYDSSATVNVATDTVLPNYASWLVHQGTVEGFRYPALNLDLAAVPALIDDWVAARLNSRIDVLNVDSKATGHAAGTVSLLDEGYTETLGPKSWKVAANCSPERPWEVFEVESPQRGRLQTGGSKLQAGVSASAVSLQVATTSGPIWTTSATFPADFPFDIEVSGERMTVTGVVGTSSPQTFTVTRAVNGVSKAQAANASVKVWRPGVLAL
jgi:hypothetical protein